MKRMTRARWWLAPGPLLRAIGLAVLITGAALFVTGRAAASPAALASHTARAFPAQVEVAARAAHSTSVRQSKGNCQISVVTQSSSSGSSNVNVSKQTIVSNGQSCSSCVVTVQGGGSVTVTQTDGKPCQVSQGGSSGNGNVTITQNGGNVNVNVSNSGQHISVSAGGVSVTIR